MVVLRRRSLSSIVREFVDNRSALEWMIDRYQVSVDKRSGIVSDPNSLEDEEYIVRLVGRVVTVSMEDWMDENAI